MQTGEDSFPAIPDGTAVYMVTYEDRKTGTVSIKTAAVKEKDGPDEALAVTVASAMHGREFDDEYERAAAFLDEFRVKSIRRECANAI